MPKAQATPTSIAGTYFTSWEYDVSSSSYQLGPIVVISSSNTVTVDGVAIKGAMVLGTSVSWSSASGNPSSAMLTFVYSSTYSAMTFSGYYWMSSDTQPDSTNIYGFATQPSAPLSTWNNTYYCYESTNSGEQSVGQLVISSPSVTFAGKTITNPIYTGLSANGTDTTELAWFTSDGNENNVAISLFNSTQDPGVQLFNGNIWASGANRPEGAPSSANNFYGTTQSESDADQVDALANLAQAAENAVVFVAVQKVAEALLGNNNDDDEEAEDNADAAEDAANQADENAQQADEAQEEQEQEQEEDENDDDADAEDTAEDAAEDIVGLAVSPDARKAPKVRGRSRKASGLSARELLGLKSQ